MKWVLALLISTAMAQSQYESMTEMHTIAGGERTNTINASFRADGLHVFVAAIDPASLVSVTIRLGNTTVQSCEGVPKMATASCAAIIPWATLRAGRNANTLTGLIISQSGESWARSLLITKPSPLPQ